MADRFASVWAKLGRANYHIDDLERQVRAYLDSDPYTLVVEYKPETAQTVVKISKLDPIPDEIVLILGDAVHNLRAVLDHFAWAAAFPVWTQPRAPTTTELHGMVNGKLLGAPQQLVQAVTALQPHEGGNGDYVWAVDYLDRMDKHRVLTTALVSYETLTIDFGPGMARDVADNPDFDHIAPTDFPSMPFTMKPTDRYSLEVGTELFAEPAGQLEQHQDIQFGFGVALGEPPSLEGEAVVPTLRKLVDQIEGVIEMLISLA